MMYYFNNEEKKMKKPNLYGFCSYFLFSHFVYKGTYNLSGGLKLATPNPIHGNFDSLTLVSKMN